MGTSRPASVHGAAAPGRVVGRERFRQLARSSQRARSGGVRVSRIDAPDHDPDQVAVAFSIPRHIGGAVVRNRWRRRARAAFVELHRSSSVAAGSYLIAPCSPDPLPYDRLAADLGAALARLASTEQGTGG